MDNFKLILWKNYRTSKRHLLITFIQVVLPILLFILLAFARSKDGLNRQIISTSTINEKYSINEFYNFEQLYLYYTAPSKDLDFYQKLIKKVQLKFQIYNNNIKLFDSELELLQYYQLHESQSTIAVIFQGNSTDKLSYILRSSDKQLDTATLHDFNHKNGEQQESKYFGTGMLSLQSALDTAYIELKSQKDLSNSLDVFLQIFPYPPYKVDSLFETYFNKYLPFVTLFSFIPIWSHLVLQIIDEKKSGAKELMKIVGLKSWMLWAGWFIQAIVPITISLVFVTILMKIPIFNASFPTIEFTNGLILFILLFLYCINAICLCFAFSMLLSNVASSISMLIWLFFYGVPAIFINLFSLPLKNTTYFFFLFPNYILNVGYSIMTLYEKREVGVQWTNIHLQPSGGNSEFSMINIFLLFIIYSLIHLLVAFYADAVMPRPQYGVTKLYLFPFYFIINKIKKIFQNKKNNSCEETELKGCEDDHRAPVVELINVSKKYGDKMAVHDIDLTLYENEITVLLGKNGAGKSTMMITGMTKASGGQILFNGRNLQDNRKHDKSSMGLCPQHNLLFPDLTVLEHLLFFARLKGKSFKEAKEEAIELLKTFKMEKKSNDLAFKLSGGMQRKLCLGMAIIGGSKILILDEPTSGLDPEARLEIWNLLLKLRKTRTILISTHLMEEAERLGDKIVIMIEGELQYLGSQHELKEKYGSGYTLMINFKNFEIMNKNLDMVEIFVRKHIPEVQLSDLKFEKNTITIHLPITEKTRISDLLDKLEENKDILDFNRLSIKYTSLNDVFLKVNPSEEEEEFNFDSLNDYKKAENQKIKKQSNQEHFKALMKKRLNHFKQNSIRYIIPYGITVTLCLISLFFINMSETSATKNNSRALSLTLSSYDLSTVYYNASTTTHSNKNILKIYENIVSKENSIVRNTPDTSAAIIDKAMENILYYNEHLVVAAEFQNHSNKMEITALYSSEAIHSAPISLNLIMNTMAKFYLGENHSISVSNSPLPSYAIKSQKLLDELTTPLEFMILIPIALLSFQGIFLIFPCSERASNFVTLQINSGVKSLNYWLVNFIFDSILSILGIILITALCWFLSLFFESIFTLYYFIHFFLMFNMFYIITLPFIYVCSYLSSITKAFFSMILFVVFFGIIPTASVKFLVLSGNEDFAFAANLIKRIFFSLFPQFVFCYQLMEFITKLVYTFNWGSMSQQDKLTYCQTNRQNPCCVDFYYFKDITGQECQKSFELDAVFFKNYCWIILSLYINFMLIVFLDSLIFRQLCEWFKNINLSIKRYKKNKQDEQFVVSNLQLSQSLKVIALKKMFNQNKAVVDVSLHSEKNKCLGILGVNGAGKTTTFKMLVRDIIQNSGTIRSNTTKLDENIASIYEISNYLKNIGYCPQFSALNEELSAKALLGFMASLRGIPQKNIPKIVKAYIELFGLDKYAESSCGTYSGGNKRKLSLAIALIGLRNLIYLDEPTTGIDLMSRHKIWKIINNLKKFDIAMVLSSHDMAECETICDYIKFLGSKQDQPQRTPNDWKKDCGGYKIILQLKSDNEQELVDKLVSNIKEHNSDLELIDQREDFLQYHVNEKTNNDKLLNSLFHQMELIKKEHTIVKDYIVNEFSLQDLFLKETKIFETN